MTLLSTISSATWISLTFRGDGVVFAVDFLHIEIELFADELIVACKQRAELFKMRGEPYELFVDGGFYGVHGNLRKDARFVDLVEVFDELAHAHLQARAIRLLQLWHTARDGGTCLYQLGDLGEQILLQSRALFGAGSEKGIEGVVQRGENKFAILLSVEGEIRLFFITRSSLRKCFMCFQSPLILPKASS